MPNVFPEKLDKINYDNLKSAVQQIEAYMRYMCERTDFAVTNVTKVAAKSGNIGAEMVLSLQKMETDVGVIKSQLAGMTGSITGVLNRMEETEKNTAELSQKVTQIEADIKDSFTEIQTKLTSIDDKLIDFEERIKKLENPE